MSKFEQELELWASWSQYAKTLGYDDWQARAWATFMVWPKDLTNADKFNLLPKLRG
jgi:hypothetical protein